MIKEIFWKKSYALEEACMVWKWVLIDKKEDSTLTDMPLGTTIHNIEIALENNGQLARAVGAILKLITKKGRIGHIKITFLENLDLFNFL